MDDLCQRRPAGAYYDIGIAPAGTLWSAVATALPGAGQQRGTIMSSKQHKKKLAAALKKMGTSLATHTQSTFKPSGAASRTLDEFKARRAAEKLGLVPKSPGKVAERFQIDVDTAQVTKLPIRPKTAERR
jgi:hypothetical protein